MKNNLPIAIILLSLISPAFAASVLRSGWTTTTSASSARGALNVYDKTETGDFFRTGYLSPASPADPYRKMFFTNGVFACPAFNAYTAGGHTAVVGDWPGYTFFRTDNNLRLGGMYLWDDHTGAPFNPELIIESPGSMALIQGAGTANQNIHIGRNGDSANYVNISYGTAGALDGLSDVTSGYGHSQPFALAAVTSGGRYANAGLLGFNDGTASTSGAGGWGDGMIRVYPQLPYWSSGSFAASPGRWTLEINTRGVVTKGNRIEEKGVSSSSSYAIDFNGIAFEDVSPSSASVTVTLANQSAASDRVNKKIVRFFSGGQTLSFTWPSGWSVLSESGSDTMPATLSPTKILRLEIEGVGSSAGNIVVRCSKGDDAGFAYDSDASTFFTAASITDGTQKAGINTFCVNRKAHGTWTSADKIAIFVGGNSTAHGKYLKGSGSITFNGSPTHNANGVTFSGSSGNYADTGFTPSTAGGTLAQNSTRMVLVIPTASTHNIDGAAGVTFAGANKSDGSLRLAISKNGHTGVAAQGINNSTGFGLQLFADDERGVTIATRTGSTAQACYQWYYNTASGATYNQADSTSVASAGLPNASVYLGCNNYGGQYQNVAYTICGWEVGGGVNSTDAQTIRDDWLALQTALAR